MRYYRFFLFVLASLALVDAFLPAVARRFQLASLADRRAPSDLDFQKVYPRKGGGGSKGGGSSRSGSSSGSSSSSSKGGSSSSSSGKGATTSNTGGRTTTGSGTRPAYGGGTYYGGGASVPYRSGTTSPLGITPTRLGIGAGLGAGLLFWPGIWYHPVYYYPIGAHGYYNHSSGRNESKPIGCGCDETVECGCDSNTNSTYFDDLIGNGSSSALNSSVVSVADVNGTSTILINGTLENGTTAAGGTESPNAAAGRRKLLETAGWWPVAAAAVALAMW